jgi:hypothetical protein
MTVDYDTPRRTRAEDQDEPLDELAVRRVEPAAALDSDEPDVFFLPDADLSGEELMVAVIPRQPDEFTCRSCFLVHHRNRLARGRDGDQICTDCA